MRESINDRENQILMTSNTDAKKQTDDSTDKKEENPATPTLGGNRRHGVTILSEV
jgi:hypothetical protein